MSADPPRMAPDRIEASGGFQLVLGPPAALEEAFLAAVAAIRERWPLVPVDVLVGTVLQRPYLQRRLADTAPGLVNVRFSTLGELGLRLGEPALAAAGLRPLPAVAERAWTAEAARACSGYFAPVASTPGFAEAAHRLLRELRREGISPDALAAAAPGSPESRAKADDLAALYRRAIADRVGFYDGDDALAAADPDRFDGFALLVVGIWGLGATARRLVRAIAARRPVTVFLPAVGRDADQAHAELRQWLLDQGAEVEELPAVEESSALGRLQARLFSPAGPIEPDGTVELVSAPDPPAEAREAARACLAWAKAGIAFREMAVSYRQAEVYRPLVEAVFAEVGIPVYLDDGPSLAERPLGRRILALVDLVGSPLRRHELMAFLSDGRMPKPTRERFGGAPAARWDSLSRRAGVVEGLEQWRRRITLLRERERAAAAEDGAPEWLRRRVEDCDSLVAFVETLAADLRAAPGRGAWSELLAWLRGLLGTYVEGAEDVVGYLDQLALLDALVPEIELARFLEIVRAEVKALKAGDLDEGQQGAFGRRGVGVLDLNQLRGLRFRAVALLGLTERAFPPPPRQDPLLLDDERQRLNRAGGFSLPLRARGADPEPLQFALAVHAARERVFLSTRRAEEAGGGRAQIPSSFFRAAAAALEGRPVQVGEVRGLRSVRYLPAGRVGAASLERSLTLCERDRTLLELDQALGRAVLERLEPRAARADALRRARWASRSLTPFDGAFADPLALEALGEELEAHVFHATQLETYAACPFRYLLGKLLGLKPLEEPEALLRMQAVAKGSLVHRILQRFVAELGAPPAPGDPQAERRTLLAIADEEMAQAAAQGLTGSPLLWGADRSEIVDDLLAWLEREHAASSRYTRSAVEVAFGQAWSEGPRSPLASEEPLVLALAGRELRLGGVIDRIDYAPDGSYRVIDYKTGAGGRLPGAGQLKGGRALQLPLYLRAGAMLCGADHTAGEAVYQVVSRRGRLRQIAFSGADYDARREEIERLLGRIVGGIAAGDFHAEPGEDCRYCDYGRACDAGRRRLRERKRDDPRVASFAELREIA
jgi:ATP-dependent helicase/nuclease subunit B